MRVDRSESTVDKVRGAILNVGSYFEEVFFRLSLA